MMFDENKHNNDLYDKGEKLICILAYASPDDPGNLLQFGDVLEYSYDDGSGIAQHKLLNLRNGKVVWYNDMLISETIRYSSLSKEEQFLFELSGKLPDEILVKVPYELDK